MPFHWQGESVITLVEGRRLVALLPPSDTPKFNPERSLIQWLANATNQAKRQTLFCVQNPGEVLVVPEGWWQGWVEIGAPAPSDRKKTSLRSKAGQQQQQQQQQTLSVARLLHGRNYSASSQAASIETLARLAQSDFDLQQGQRKANRDHSDSGSDAAEWWKALQRAMAATRESDAATLPPPQQQEERSGKAKKGGLIARAVADLTIATSLNRANAPLQLALGLGLMERSGMESSSSAQDVTLKKAHVALTRAVELNPFDLRSYYHLARLDWGLTNYRSIVESLDIARGT